MPFQKYFLLNLRWIIPMIKLIYIYNDFSYQLIGAAYKRLRMVLRQSNKVKLKPQLIIWLFVKNGNFRNWNNNGMNIKGFRIHLSALSSLVRCTKSHQWPTYAIDSNVTIVNMTAQNMNKAFLSEYIQQYQ